MKEFFIKFPRACICVILSLVLGFTVFFRAQELKKSSARYDQTSHYLDVILRNQLQAGALSADLKELTRLTAGLDQRIISADDKAGNYQFFYDIEAKSRATISDLKQLGTDSQSGGLRASLKEFSGTAFDFKLGGRAGYVMLFLKRLESGRYFVRCNSASFRGNPTVGPDGVDVVLKLEVLTKK